MNSLQYHYPEYLMEAAGLGLFLLSASVVTAVLEHPASLLHQSMNPARTFASASSAQNWAAIWVYFTAPLLGMFAAAELYIHWHGRKAVRCAKLHHHNQKRCIFHCGYRNQGSRNGASLLSWQRSRNGYAPIQPPSSHLKSSPYLTPAWDSKRVSWFVIPMGIPSG